jgi:hypothetical protein
MGALCGRYRYSFNTRSLAHYLMATNSHPAIDRALCEAATGVTLNSTPVPVRRRESVYSGSVNDIFWDEEPTDAKDDRLVEKVLLF